MSIQLVIFDVDGTLYDEKTHQVPSSAIAAIKAMKKKQVRFAIATGRAPYGLGKAIDSLHADYVIADSGGLVVDQTGTILWKQDIPYTDVCSLLTFAQEIEAGLVFKFPRHMYIYELQFLLSFLDKPFPNGESLKDVEKRVKDFIQFLKKDYQGKTIGIVAHRAPQLAFEVLIKNISWEEANKETLDKLDEVLKGLGGVV